GQKAEYAAAGQQHAGRDSDCGGAGTPQPAHCRAKPVRQPVDEAIEALIAAARRLWRGLNRKRVGGRSIAGLHAFLQGGLFVVLHRLAVCATYIASRVTSRAVIVAPDAS